MKLVHNTTVEFESLRLCLIRLHNRTSVFSYLSLNNKILLLTLRLKACMLNLSNELFSIVNLHR